MASTLVAMASNLLSYWLLPLGTHEPRPREEYVRSTEAEKQRRADAREREREREQKKREEEAGRAGRAAWDPEGKR